MKFNKKKLLMFGIPLLAVVLVSAALLTYYGVITGITTVTQSVTVEDSPITGAWNTVIVAGETIIDCDDDDSGHSVKNNADVPAPIKFGTRCNNSVGYDDGTRNEADIDWANLPEWSNDKCDGIETKIYGILELTKKNTETWVPTNDKITITYTIVGDEFDYEVIDGEIPIGYELVYAMDKDDRWTNYASVIKVADVDGDLPYSEDWNANPDPDYCDNHNTFDDYEHCSGAKLWIVDSNDLGTPTEDNVYPLTWANMNNYYYETDLIVYSSDIGNEITLPANGGGFSFCVENDFAFNLAPDTYTIEIQVLPVA